MSKHVILLSRGESYRIIVVDMNNSYSVLYIKKVEQAMWWKLTTLSIYCLTFYNWNLLGFVYFHSSDSNGVPKFYRVELVFLQIKGIIYNRMTIANVMTYWTLPKYTSNKHDTEHLMIYTTVKQTAIARYKHFHNSLRNH